jgi:Zn-dependent protease with chaperone function
VARQTFGVSRDEFDTLVKKVEAIWQADPKRYMTRVVGLLFLVYGFLALMLLGSLAGLVGCIALVFAAPALFKLTLIGLVIFGGFFWAIARGLWVRMKAPEGQRITRQQAPALFKMLDELRVALDCQPFHEVLLIAQHNAAVVQNPRLGIFGWHRNYLLLGLPLMQSLAPDEFKAVLAHEFAHSSRGHGRFGNWLYRVRRTWDRIIEHMMKQRTAGGGLLLKFLDWFWPIFNAHVFVLARANEYEADACSVRLAGADAAAGALTRLPIDENLLSEKIWPGIFELAIQQREPPAEVMLVLQKQLKAGAKPAEASRWLRQAFMMETNNLDTHPCLKDRLRAMGRLPADAGTNESPVAPLPPERSAAEEYLGAHAEVAARLLSEEWRSKVRTFWADRHDKARKTTAELAELEQPAATPPTPDTLWKRACALIDLHGDDKAMPTVDHLLALDANHAGGNFVRGRKLLERDDPQGLTFLEAAMTHDPMLTESALQLVYGHFVRTGQRDKLRSIEDRVDRFREQQQFAQIERGNVNSADTFLPSELNAEHLAALRQAVSCEEEVVAAAVVRKRVMNFPQVPCYVIGLRVKVSWWKPRSTDANQQLMNRVLGRIQFPGHHLTFVVTDQLKALGHRVFAVPGAVVYEQPKK